MKTIDIHAHLVPKSLWQAADAGREWYGFRHEPGDGLGSMLGGGRRTSFSVPQSIITIGRNVPLGPLGKPEFA